MSLRPAQRRLLDAIAAGEANGYDVLYGGGRFGSYADHPRQAIPIASGPNAGKTSSAAGRYQFLGSTWDETAKELGLKDFSPESQDAAAWHLANKTYATKTGRDLTADLEAGRTDEIAGALKGIWTSIPGGIEPNAATGGFGSRVAGKPAGLLDEEPPQSTGLLAVNDTQPQGSGLLGGLMQSQMQAQPAPQFEAPDMPQAAMMRRKPVDLSRLQAMIKQTGAGRSSWG